MTTTPIAILGGGPVGLTLALQLARRRVPSVVVDARDLDEARRDRRLLALSRGTLDTLGAVIDLPPAALAPIRTVVVSSRGQFGRAVLDERDNRGRPLGATIRYGELLTALDAACKGEPLVELRRRCTASAVSQGPSSVDVRLSDGSSLSATIAVNAEGVGAGNRPPVARQSALTGDVEVRGPTAGTAFERFTRDGPLALLPLPGPAVGATRPMSLVWCMPTAAADRRESLSDAELLAELQAESGERNGRVVSIRSRGRYPLIEQARDEVREHRLVHVGNAAQSLHPVAGQGLNLGVRDCVALADLVASAIAAAEDPLARLPEYEQRRRADRVAIRTLTGSVPGFFATGFAPVAAARSLGLTMLSIFPDLRAEFARFLMFGVRS
jgi:2-octaprenyl-6-methoxyphenol hydroxylase